jgi:hypothetical protein
MIPIMFPLAPASHILVALVQHDPNLSPLDQAGHILVSLINHDPDIVPPGPSWSHFGQLGLA